MLSSRTRIIRHLSILQPVQSYNSRTCQIQHLFSGPVNSDSLLFYNLSNPTPKHFRTDTIRHLGILEPVKYIICFMGLSNPTHDYFTRCLIRYLGTLELVNSDSLFFYNICLRHPTMSIQETV